MGIKKAEYEANNDSNSKEQKLELMGALRVLISRDDSAIVWAKRKYALCFLRFVVDRIPTPVLGECIKPFGKGELMVGKIPGAISGHAAGYTKQGVE